MSKHRRKTQNKEKLPNTREEYITAERKANFKCGDKVIILRKAKAYEHGWYNSWPSPMDLTIGQIDTVVQEPSSKFNFATGIRLAKTGLSYPYFVLKKVNQ